MAKLSGSITPCLWFDTRGEEAADFYVSIFENSRIKEIVRYNEAGPREEGTVMVVSFELCGQPFTALNGGPEFTFDEAISFQITCETADDLDHYWDRLVDGGQPGPCGWLKDRFGLSWQVIPARLFELLSDPDPAVVANVNREMLTQTGKLDVAALERAASAAHV
jgi:predicted 3-demethylubiquinone-9 3-methyltransferase (glyoxalase superfamily)